MTSLIFSINLIGLVSLIIVNKIKVLEINKPLLLKQIALLTSILIIFVTTYYALMFDCSEIGYQFIDNFFNITWGIDGISLVLIILTSLLIPLALLSNYKNIQRNEGIFVFIIVLLGALVSLNFLCFDLLSFYLLFEATLPPLFLLIGIWGENKQTRVVNYVLLFTLGSSLFMLLSIALLIFILNTGDYLAIFTVILSLELQSVVWIGLFIGIAVKAALMPVHVWLPVVHSESPLAGSIFLGRVNLKVAIYAVVRLLLSNLSEASVIFVPFVSVNATLTIILTSLITLRQTDLKVIIAYSSIGHLGVCVLGIFANNLIGIEGSILLCLAHGFVSPALFLGVGGVIYDRYHHRLLHYYQGLSSYMPLFSLYLVIFSFCNIGTPLSANFLGEFLSLFGAFQRIPLLTGLAVSSVLLSGCYQMKVTNKLKGGQKSIHLTVQHDLSNRELFLFNLLLFPTLFIGFYPSAITQFLHFSSATYLYHL